MVWQVKWNIQFEKGNLASIAQQRHVLVLQINNEGGLLYDPAVFFMEKARRPLQVQVQEKWGQFKEDDCRKDTRIKDTGHLITPMADNI